MAKKTPEVGYEGLGDITELMHNQGVTDLSWLAVDAEDYRASEALPHQNLDAIPELQEALTYEDDERVPQLIPLRPHAVVNSNPLERAAPPSRTPGSIVGRVAQYVMEGLRPADLGRKLQAEFSPGQIRAAASDIRDVLLERGVLGNVYVSAAHFPRCAQKGPHREFVAKRCKSSLFVLSKPECTRCVQNKQGRCASFGKRIVDQVPYTRRTYAHYFPMLLDQRRITAADVPRGSPMSDRERKERLRAAFNRTPLSGSPDPVRTAWQQDKPRKPEITDEDVRSFWRRRLATPEAEAMPGPMVLLAAGKVMSGSVVATSLASSSDPAVRELAREHGILGHTYLDGDALGGPRQVLDHIRINGLSPDFVLLRSASDDPALVELKKRVPVVSRRPELGFKNLVNACERAVSEGRMGRDQMMSALKKIRSSADSSWNWPRLVAQANLLRAPEVPRVAHVQSAQRGARLHHVAAPAQSMSSVVDPEEVRRSISHLMNTGLTGKALQDAVLSRYTRGDLAQFPDVGRRLAADDGVQGVHFVDPTAYADYGRGCQAGSKSFKGRGPRLALAGSACTGCTHQTAPAWCSRYAKKLIRHVPAELRRQAAEKRSLPVVAHQSAPLTNPVEQWGLSADLPVEIAPPRPKPISVTVSSPEVGD